jgi:hypothetical protein
MKLALTARDLMAMFPPASPNNFWVVLKSKLNGLMLPVLTQPENYFTNVSLIFLATRSFLDCGDI